MRQQVYAPQGWIESADGNYVLGGYDWRVSMPVLVVSKSDITLHPAITVNPGKHAVSLTRASWILQGQSYPPHDHEYEGVAITQPQVLNLHWEFPSGKKAVDALGRESTIRLELVVDGAPRTVDILIQRQDHY